jgi:hypothetical protein
MLFLVVQWFRNVLRSAMIDTIWFGKNIISYSYTCCSGCSLPDTALLNYCRNTTRLKALQGPGSFSWFSFEVIN